MTVNGLAVTGEEFVWFAQQERAGVIQHFQKKHRAAYDTQFWTNRFGSITPHLELQRRTTARITREKVEQQLFAELGLIRDASYDEFTNEFAQTNCERAAAKAANKAIYGPVTFDELQYFKHRTATLQRRAREILATNRLAASEAGLRACYETNRAAFKTTALASWEFVAVKARPDSPVAAGDLKWVAAKIERQLHADVAPINIVSGLLNDARFEAHSQVLKDMTEERLAESLSEEKAFARASKMKPGKTTILKLGADSVLVAKCVARKPSEVMAFEDARPQVRRMVLQTRYDKLIAELISNAKVTMDDAKLNAIPIE